MATKTARGPVAWMGVRVDWRARPPAWVAINVALATAAYAGAILGAPWALWAAAVAGVCTMVTAATTTPKPVTELRIAWRTTGALIAAVWTVWVVLAGPSALAWIVGGSATVAAVGGSLLVQRRHNAALVAAREQAELAAALQAAEADLLRPAGELFHGAHTDITAYAANWKARIERVCNLVVTIPKAIVWESGVGIDLFVELPVGGSTPADIRSDVQQLAADANLPRGCSVVVADGEEGQRIAYLSISHVNVLKDDVDPPTDTSALSIHDPITVAKFSDSSDAEVDLREQSLIIVGMKGSGKTNCLRVLTREIMRRPDALVWCIDIGGGGGLVRDLMRPYYDGHVSRPPIDWPILDVETAEYALDALLGIIPARKRIYDTTNLQPTWDVPQIMLITDELGNVPGHLKSKLVQCSDLGRASAHQQINCSLRGIEGYIPRDLVVQSAEAIVLGVAKEVEAQYVFDWESRIKISDIQGDPGRGLTKRRTNGVVGGIEQIKIPHLYRDESDPNGRDDLADAAIALNHLRPTLDTPSADIANQVSKGRYARRFELASPLLWYDSPPIRRADLVEDTGDADLDAHRRAMADFEEKIENASMGELLEMLDNPATAADDSTEAAEPAEPPTLVTPDEAAELAALVGGASDTRDRVAEIVLDAGPTGVAPAAVLRVLEAKGQAISDRHVRRVLAGLVKQGVVYTPAEGHYVHTRYLGRG